MSLSFSSYLRSLNLSGDTDVYAENFAICHSIFTKDDLKKFQPTFQQLRTLGTIILQLSLKDDLTPRYFRG
jgi:hypothetical protein